MENNKATLEGPYNLLLIELLEKTIIKIKYKTLIMTKTRCLYFKKIITKSTLRQIKPKQNKINQYFNKNSYGNFSQCDWVTGRQKEQKGAKFKNKFLFFLKINDFKIDSNHKILTKIAKKLILYRHRKQLRPIIIQCTS